MLEDLNDHPMAIAHQIERDAVQEEQDRRMDLWFGEVEKLLDVDSLDEDENQVGYSIDGAVSAFCAGNTPQEYADQVMAWQFKNGL